MSETTTTEPRPAAITGAIDPTDPAIASPLGPFHGERPASPDWFRAALANEPDRRMISVDGVEIETLVWGEAGRPGLILLHGNSAHADWYSFIAPFFAETHRVVAMSWSGMGRSGWRERYSLDRYADEVVGVAEATGLFDGGARPMVAAHSFGGGIAIRMSATLGDRFAGMIILDTMPRPPHLRWKGPPDNPHRGARIYPDEVAALARFRLMPPQGCENLYIVDHIARHSLKPTTTPDGEAGWGWRFDPNMWAKMDRAVAMESELDLAAAKCPMAFVWGQQSQLVPQAAIDYSMPFMAPMTPMIAVPNAQHHLMLDQPLATVTAIRALLSVWPPRGA